MTDFLKLKKSNCKNCYKCIRHCPVKSIRFSGNQAHIVGDECILCGQCFVVCPQNAKEIFDSTETAKNLLGTYPTVIASVAPSFAANYDGIDIAIMEKALKKLGFTAAEETDLGAALVKTQYEAIIAEGRQDVIISSCCPSVNLLIQKHFPAALPYLARVMTPMQAHAMDIRKRYPDAKVVFIGPCISKKEEADTHIGSADCVMTFEELTKWMAAKDIDFEYDTENKTDLLKKTITTGSFPTPGGIIKSMKTSPDYVYMNVDGTENCINALKDIISGKLTKCFIEMSSCAGSCIGGPIMEKNDRNPVRDYATTLRYTGTEEYVCDCVIDETLMQSHSYIGTGATIPGHDAISDILQQMGKTTPEDELNCGSCGYNTCREKAIAIYQGKADMTMCLPFLKDRAESFSDTIIQNTPNGIFVLNDQLEVQQINASALRILNIRYASDVLGEQVIRIMDPYDFMQVLNEGKFIRDKRIYLAEYSKYVEETILYDRNYHILICILRDVTEEEQQRSRKEQLSRQTIEITDKVVEKQMRVVQEIASLLGETTAETKIALTKLKDSLRDE